MSGPPFTVKALFEYTSEHEDDLNFSIGQVITVTEEEDDEWFYGNYTDEAGNKKEGLFPRNFVERYEPPAPPRPSRPSRHKKESEPAPAPAPEAILAPAVAESKPPRGSIDSEPAAPAEPGQSQQAQSAPAPPSEVVESPPPIESSAATTQQAAPSRPEENVESGPKPIAKPGPPPVSDKPSASSFRDRIAAFNKPAAAPVTPFNPTKPAASTAFIKKPFVAPPPSKNAYIPPPQPVQPPQKVYRREEDPEIQERAAEAEAGADRPVISHEAEGAEGDDDQPKPTSLKERIALLQKQQLEQAALRAAAAQKKEKPKKPPPKKRVEPEPHAQHPAESQELELGRAETSESVEYRAESAHHQEEAPQPRRPSAISGDPSLSQQPPRELTSDTNDADYSGAGDTEGADESSTSKEDLSDGHPGHGQPAAMRETAQDEDDEQEAGEETEEEDIDPEVKRRMELRERMAKMSGGMGMMGMFGAPAGGMPGMAPGGMKKPKPQPAAEPERKSSEEKRPHPVMHAPPIPLMGLPGMHTKKEQVATPPEDESDGSAPQLTPVPTSDPHHILGSQPNTSRQPPPPPPRAPEELPERTRPRETHEPSTLTAESAEAEGGMSPSLGEESDDELSGVPRSEVDAPGRSGEEEEYQLPAVAFNPEPERHPTSPGPKERRFSRGPPPLPPSMAPAVPAPAHSRPPPPPPPGSMSRKSTSDSRAGVSPPTHAQSNDSDEEVTEYDGDYDTDIAPGAKHKDALRSHVRDSSLEEGTITDEATAQSPVSSPHARPPIPSTTAPRAVPPPPPTQPPKQGRKSSEVPRGAPPPVPPGRSPYEDAGNRADHEYDPFRYDPGLPPRRSEPVNIPVRSPAREIEEPDLYSASPPLDSAPFAPPPPPPPERGAVPPPPPTQSPPLQAARNPPRQSMDILRGPGSGRRSMDVSRPSMDQGYIATDVDLSQHTLWWAQPNTPPPVFQDRRDLLFEIEESSTSKRGGKTYISKDIYVLFMDYSQTFISVKFDSKNPEDVVFEQRSEPPPQRLRQDQLENAHARFGSRISDAVSSKQNTVVGDGSPHGLVESLLRPLSDALLPVGTRAYGALVYANLANASVQQFDEIRAGDIVSFRNARFQGHRGTMHQKYNVEVGKPDHVGVVVDWDGTKKKIRAWEQGRESKKVKMESFKLGDLKSGECRVWRVMPRSWVGWDDESK